MLDRKAPSRGTLGLCKSANLCEHRRAMSHLRSRQLGYFILGLGLSLAAISCGDSGGLSSQPPAGTPRPTPTLDPTEAASRDTERQEALGDLADSLQSYYELHRSYPVAGRLQSFCRFPIDAGCAVAEELGPLPEDPSGDRFYLYQSDGATFILLAQMDGPPPPSECPEPLPGSLAGRDDLYCLQGSPSP